MNTRIYLVRDRATDAVRLVEAANPAQAIRHAALQAYHVKPAKAIDVAYHMGKGAKVEIVKPEQAEIEV